MNEYEIECTSKFEGAYTAQEVVLNNKLYDECTKDVLDCAVIETLLKQGADPLGATAVSGWGLLEHIYGEIIMNAFNSGCQNLPRITELFLRYGMELDNPRVPYDDDNSLHPIGNFSFLADENVICALEILLDNGLSVDSAGEMWRHIVFDLVNVNREDPNDGDYGTMICNWAIRCIMLFASYDHILNNDKELQEYIDCASNCYDLHKFRKWENFYCKFDTSHCNSYPEFYKSVVRIYEKETQQMVWTVAV